MSEIQETDDRAEHHSRRGHHPEPEALSPADEPTMLKERAKTLGVPLGGNVGVDTLRKKTGAKLSGSKDVEPPPDELTSEVVEKPKTRAQIEQEIGGRLQKEKMAGWFDGALA